MLQGPYGNLFNIQPLPQPGRGCRERFVVWHSYANGVPISKTEVAITNGGQVVAIHPRFRLDDVDERRKEPITLRDVLYMPRTSIRPARAVGEAPAGD
jgi:hypothetical protein